MWSLRGGELADGELARRQAHCWRVHEEASLLMASSRGCKLASGELTLGELVAGMVADGDGVPACWLRARCWGLLAACIASWVCCTIELWSL